MRSPSARTKDRINYASIVVAIAALLVGIYGTYLASQSNNAPFLERADLVQFSGQTIASMGQQEFVGTVTNYTTEPMLNLDILLPNPYTPDGLPFKQYAYDPPLASCQQVTISEPLNEVPLEQFQEAHIVFRLFDRHPWSETLNGNPGVARWPPNGSFPDANPLPSSAIQDCHPQD